MQSSSTSVKANDPSTELLHENAEAREYIGKIKSKEVVGHCAYSLWENKKKSDNPRLVVFFIHDIYDSCARYQHFFQYLKKHYNDPLTLVGIDLVGMGQSSGHRGYVSSFDSYCIDSINVVNTVIRGHKEKTINALIGVGLGGLVGLRSVEQFSAMLDQAFDGMALINPLIRPTFRIPGAFNDNLSRLVPRFDRKRFMLPYRGPDLCDNLQLAAYFDADVSVQKFLTVAKAREILETARKVRAAAYFINNPTLILSSEGPLNDHEAIGLFHKGLNSKQSRHIFFKYCSHDLLNGRRQTKAFKLILNWLNSGYTYANS